jgi:hypothetical protein
MMNVGITCLLAATPAVNQTPQYLDGVNIDGAGSAMLPVTIRCKGRAVYNT